MNYICMETYEADHFPEVADKAMRRVEYFGLQEELASGEKRREYFGSLSNEEFKKMLYSA